MAERESKWPNASRNGQTRVETAKRESKRPNASQNGIFLPFSFADSSTGSIVRYGAAEARVSFYENYSYHNLRLRLSSSAKNVL